MLTGIDGLPMCGGRAWSSLRIRTRSLCHVEKHHPLNGLFNVTPPYPHHQNQRRLTLSTPLRPKPNQYPPSSPRATRLQAHSAFLLRRFFLNTPLSSRPAEDFTSHIPFDRSHVIGPFADSFDTPSQSNQLSQSSDTSRIKNQLLPQILAGIFRHYVLDDSPGILHGSSLNTAPPNARKNHWISAAFVHTGAPRHHASPACGRRSAWFG